MKKQDSGFRIEKQGENLAFPQIRGGRYGLNLPQSTHIDPLSSLPPVIFLMGPTASGKTSVAVELAESMPVEIISVDSALVYRGMNIGTAKPDVATLARAPHHLIDIRDPTEAYSAAAFRHDVRAHRVAELRDLSGFFV